jgi:predicted branched-subunit amino acid permease
MDTYHSRNSMITFFDMVTVACFIGLAAAFFRYTDHEIRTLLQFLISAVVLAVANQVGNAGSILLAAALVIAGIGYALLIIRQQSSRSDID